MAMCQLGGLDHEGVASNPSELRAGWRGDAERDKLPIARNRTASAN